MINRPDPVPMPPADAWSINLSYCHDQRWWFDANEEPETWQISADIHDDSGTHVESHVGDMTIVLVDAYQAEDPFDLLDGEAADLGLIAESIFDPATGGLDPELDQHLEPLGSRILILRSVRLTPEWRGLGLGALLAGTAIKKLSGGARAAVCHVAPLEEEVDHRAAQAKLTEVWATLGFQHFRNDIHVLDLNLVTLDENLGKLRKDAERYRTYD